MKKLVYLLVLSLCINGLAGVSSPWVQSARAASKTEEKTETKSAKKTKTDKSDAEEKTKKKEKKTSEGKSDKAGTKAAKATEKLKKSEVAKEKEYTLDLEKNSRFALSVVLKYTKMDIKLKDVKSIELEDKKDKKYLSWAPDEENEKDYIFTVLKNFKELRLRIVTAKRSRLLVLKNGTKESKKKESESKSSSDEMKKAPVQAPEESPDSGKKSKAEKQTEVEKIEAAETIEAPESGDTDDEAGEAARPADEGKKEASDEKADAVEAQDATAQEPVVSGEDAGQSTEAAVEAAEGDSEKAEERSESDKDTDASAEETAESAGDPGESSGDKVEPVEAQTASAQEQGESSQVPIEATEAQDEPAEQQGESTEDAEAPVETPVEATGESDESSGNQDTYAGEQGESADVQSEPTGEQGESADVQSEPTGEQGESAEDQGESTEEAGESDEEPGESAENPGESGEEPGESAEEPGESDEKPGDTTEEPGESDEEPGKSDEEQGESAEEAVESDEEPDDTTEDPGKSDEEPGDTTEEAGESDEDPGESDEEPGDTEEDPGESKEDPGESTEEPDEPTTEDPGAEDDGDGQDDDGSGDGESQPEEGASIPETAEAWFKRGSELLWGTLEEVIGRLTGGETVYIQESKLLLIRKAPLEVLSTVTMLPDSDTFKGSYSVCISTDNPALVSEPALIQPVQMPALGETADLYVWVSQDKAPAPEDGGEDEGDEKPVLEVRAKDFDPSEWSKTQPRFTLSGIPEGKEWSYAAIIYDERIVPIASNVFVPDQEGVYTLRFAMLNELGDIMSASDQYTLQLDWTPPEVSIETDEEESYTLNISATDKVSGLDAVSIDRGKTWYPIGEEGYTVKEEAEKTFKAGAIRVRDVAGNVFKSEEDYTLEEVESDEGGEEEGGEGGGSGGGGGSGSGTPALPHSSGDGEEGADYDALALDLPDDPMEQLTVGGETMALTLMLASAQDSDAPVGANQPFTAQLRHWKNASDSGELDTLLLCAEIADDLGDAFSYEWHFNGEVYRMLANSGIRYVALKVDDAVAAFPTEGFTGGTRYTELKMQGVSTKKFDYTLTMKLNLDPSHVSAMTESDYSQECDLSIHTVVEDTNYELSNSPQSMMYFYNVFLGPEDMLDQPFGEYGANAQQ